MKAVKIMEINGNQCRAEHGHPCFWAVPIPETKRGCLDAEE